MYSLKFIKYQPTYYIIVSFRILEKVHLVLPHRFHQVAAVAPRVHPDIQDLIMTQAILQVMLASMENM